MIKTEDRRFVILRMEKEDPLVLCVDMDMRERSYIKILEKIAEHVDIKTLSTRDSAVYTLSAMAAAGNGCAAEALSRYLVSHTTRIEYFQEVDIEVPIE